MSETVTPPRGQSLANLKDVLGTTNEQLAQAKSLTGTILPDGSTHA